MPLSHDLQNMIAEVNATIAAGRSLGRVDLQKLQRNLDAAARDAGRMERDGVRSGDALGTLCDGIDRQVADLTGLVRHARSLAPAVQ